VTNRGIGTTTAGRNSTQAFASDEIAGKATVRLCRFMGSPKFSTPVNTDMEPTNWSSGTKTDVETVDSDINEYFRIGP